MYDTVYKNIDDTTMSFLNLMFSKNITVTLVPLQKQQGMMDCGVFSVAMATSLLRGLNPGFYTQSLLWPHLIECTENKSMVSVTDLHSTYMQGVLIFERKKSCSPAGLKPATF